MINNLLDLATLAATKKILFFDLDKTLVESKQDLDAEMAELLTRLLAQRIVSVIGGGALNQFQNQLIKHLDWDRIPKDHFYIQPTSGAQLYSRSNDRLEQVYALNLSVTEKQQIRQAFERALQELNYQAPAQIYGEVLEDRDSQMTWSPLGQEAPLLEKEAWQERNDIRPRLVALLKQRLPDLSIVIGGSTSIDVTKLGIDKAYGVSQLLGRLNLSQDDCAYVGDALFPGGNDSAVLRLGIMTVPVAGPSETKLFIKNLLANLDKHKT